MHDGRRPVTRPTRHRWLLGCLGFLSLLGLSAFASGNALQLFWFAFAGFYGYFGERWPVFRHLWVLGPLGFGVGLLGVVGFHP